MRWADRMTDAMVAMSKAFLNLPIGEVEAAVEGRPVDFGRQAPDDPKRNQTCPSATCARRSRRRRPAMQAGMRAVSAALPAMMKGLSDAQRELERATANMPRPDYPRR